MAKQTDEEKEREAAWKRLGDTSLANQALLVAPDDALADDAWAKIMALAEKHALIVQAYGGSATLATPAAQRDAGLRNKCLRMARFREEV